MAHTLELTVDHDAAGTRLDTYLAAALSCPQGGMQPLSRARLQALIAGGHVSVSGTPQRVKAAHKLRPQDCICITLPDPAPAGLHPVPMDLDILFEDEHLVVLNKPAHLPVHPGAGPPKPTLVHGLLAHCHNLSGIGGVQRPGIVHRLDAGTTGLMVVAKHDLSHRHLSKQFASRSVRKGYVALVHRSRGGQRGALDGTQGLIDTPYGRDPKHRHRMTGRGLGEVDGRRARTAWRLVSQNHEVALVAVTLLTGRTHQIRVHLSEMGCPIVADPVYGPEGLRLPTGCSTLDHQALHAAYLGLLHPVTQQALRFRAPIPPSWHGLAHSLPALGAKADF